MSKTQHPSQILCFLFANTTKASSIFLTFLTKSQLLNILFLNHSFYTSLKYTPEIYNKIFYQTYLHIDKSSIYDFYYDINYLNIENKTIQSIIQLPNLAFSQQIHSYQFILYQLSNNINYFIPKQKSIQITLNLINILKNPCLPLPKLRRQTIGAYCSTPLQIFIAQLNWVGRTQEDEQQLYFDLKQSIIEKQSQIAQYFGMPKNQEFLLEMRYKTQKILDYKQTESPFINIILLILKLIDLYLNSIQTLLNAYSKTNNIYDHYIEFLVRYNTYRNSILQFEEKISFLFLHFDQTFQLNFQNYCTKPTFGLWRLMQKKWILKMESFHQLNIKVYLYLILKQGQNRINNLINNQEKNQSQSMDYPLFDKQVQYKILKNKRNSEIYLSQTFPSSIQLQYFQQNNHYYSNLITDYTQYLIDISINQITVHWCGSTQQILGIYYMDMENALSDQNYQYLKYCYHIFQNLAVSKRIYQQYLDFLNEYLKPRTIKRINRQTNQFLEDIKNIIQDKRVEQNNIYGLQKLQMQCIQNWKLKQIQFDDTDEKINYLAMQKQLDQNDVVNHGMFFNLQQEVDFELLDKIVKGNQELDWSIGQTKDHTQSFVSQEQKKQDELGQQQEET